MTGPGIELIVFGAAAIACVFATAVAIRLTAEPPGDRNASRPARRSPRTGAREQRARAGKARAIFPRARAIALATTGWGLHTAGQCWRAARTWWAFHRPRRQLSTEDRITLNVIGQMHADDTGGLLALPRYDTTVQIAAVDRQAAVRTLTVHHEPFLAAPTNGPAAALPAPPAVAAAGQPDMGPGAGLPHPGPVTTATCAGADDTPKVDSPAPADPPGADPVAAALGGPGDAPGPEGAERSAAPSPAPAAPDAFTAAFAAVRAVQDLTPDEYAERLAGYDHSDATDSFAAIAADWRDAGQHAGVA